MKKSVVQNQCTVKYHNSNMVWNIIRDNQKKKPISRADIAKETQMSPTSITRITSLLMELGLVDQAETFSTGVGRKGINLCIVKDFFYTLGVSIDSDYIHICILDCEGDVLKYNYKKLDNRVYEVEEIINQAKTLYNELCEEDESLNNKVKVVGISCTGNINHTTGDVYFAAQMKWNQKVNIKVLAEDMFQLPVFVDNDLKMALVGATFQSDSMKRSDVTYVTIGTGVGVSVMYSGKIIRGISNAAGEVGHTIFEPHGRTCVCGRKGCLATYLTDRGLVDICQTSGHNVNSIEEIMESYLKNEAWAITKIEEFANNISILLCNMIYTYNTKYILISGSIIVDYPVIYDLAYKKLKGLIHDNLYLDVIVKPIFKKDSAVLGAARVAQNEYISQLIKNQGDCIGY